MMMHIRSVVRTGFITLATFLLTFAAPTATFADTSSDCVAPASTDSGVHKPVGSDAGMYTYQCSGPYAGKWVSAYYVFDPDTYATTPLYAPDYDYDCSAGKWYKTEWDYSAPLNNYVKNRVVASDPGLPTGCPVAAPASGTSSDSGGSAANSSPTANGTNAIAGGSGSSTAVTGPGSNNTGNTDLNNTLNGTNLTTATMNNTITGVATSGNSAVLSNTTAGNAATGNALSSADIINLLQSSSNALGTGSNVITFTKDINGDVYGDLILDPNQLATVQPASASTTTVTGPGSTTTTNAATNNTLTINNSTDAAINNDIKVGAYSGDATVSTNTTGGDATTGNATAIANVVNMINSILSAGHSFIGTININGNLNGDILLPPNFVDQLVASNVPTVTITAPNSPNSSDTTVTNNQTVTNTNNQGITNTVTTAAASGDANVNNNTTAGGATTGSATTKITAFNLTGSQIIGNNAILVFVNVQGQWVGLIVNAPEGATAAELGGGLTQNTTVNNTTDVSNTTNQRINNNILADAKSGNANVTYNTTGGSAKSGNARAAVNLLNVENSTQSLTGWLGILFINVFGTWHGSFGINTSAGDPLPTPSNAQAGSGAPGHISQVFRFVPSAPTTKTTTTRGGGTSTTYRLMPYGASGGSVDSDSGRTSSDRAVLAASTNTPGSGTPAPQLHAARSNLTKKLATIAAATIGYIAIDTYFTTRSERKKAAKAAAARAQSRHLTSIGGRPVRA